MVPIVAGMDRPSRSTRQNGPAIRYLRTRARISLVDLANAAGVSRSHMSHIELEVRSTSFDTLTKIAERIGVPNTAINRDPSGPMVCNGETIAAARRLAGFDQENFAAKVGVDKHVIALIEQGHHTPNNQILQLIAHHLRATPAAFLHAPTSHDQARSA